MVSFLEMYPYETFLDYGYLPDIQLWFLKREQHLSCQILKIKWKNFMSLKAQEIKLFKYVLLLLFIISHFVVIITLIQCLFNDKSIACSTNAHVSGAIVLLEIFS